MNTQTTKLCPKCSEPKVNDIHMFHLCAHLHVFWEEVGKVINKVLGRDIKVSTFLIIFGILDTVDYDLILNKNQKYLLFVLILLARREICVNWILPTPPKINDWLASVRKIKKLDSFRGRTKRTKYWDLWNEEILEG